jgi:hypothetical protein
MKLKNWLVKNRRIFQIWSIVAIVVTIAAYIIAAPYGDKLGAPQSPTRGLFYLVMDFWVLKLPLALLAASYIARYDRWLAPRGRYIEGKEYPVFSTYFYTAAAFMAALFAASGALNFQLIDLPAAPATISVIYFNPIVGFVAVWLGDVIRALLFPSQTPVIIWLISTGLGDGAVWAIMGLLYWEFRENTQWGKNILAQFVVWSVIFWVMKFFQILTALIWIVPANMYVPGLAASVSFLLSGYLASMLGLIVAEGLILTQERREQSKGGASEVATLKPEQK